MIAEPGRVDKRRWAGQAFAMSASSGPPLVLLPHEVTSAGIDANMTGQKAAGLCRLLAAKARVPRFCVITRAAFDLHCAHPQIASLLRDVRGKDTLDRVRAQATADRFVRAVQAAPLPEAVDEALTRAHGAFQADDRFAVRSSPILDEERAEVYAGAFETYLYVPDLEGLQGAVRRAFAHAFSSRVLTAAATAGDRPFSIPLAVIVQRMVDAHSSGLCQSHDPTTRAGEENRILIRATFGLAGGMSAPGRRLDSFRIEREPSEEETPPKIEVRTEDKREVVRFDDERGQGTRIVRLDEGTREAPALDGVQTHSLVSELLRIEEAFSQPVSLEFAFTGRRLHLLQVSPQFLPRQRVASRRLRRFDDRLLPEGLAGRCAPLTFGFFHSAFPPAFDAAIFLLGADEREMRGRAKARGRLVAYLEGRAFVNVGAVKTYLDALGEGQLISEGLVSVFGVEGLVEGGAASAPDNDADAFMRLCRQSKKLTQEAQGYAERARPRLEALAKQLQGEPDPDEVVDLLDELSSELRGVWSHQIACSFMAAGLYNAIERMVQAWLDTPMEGAGPALLAGEFTELPSLGIDTIRALVDAGEASDALAQLFDGTALHEDLSVKLAGLQGVETFTDEFARALRSLGPLRLPGAAKLEVPSLQDRPDVLLQVVRARFDEDPPERPDFADGVRSKADYETTERMSDKRMRLLRHSRRRVFERVLDETRAVLGAKAQLVTVSQGLLTSARATVQRAGDRLFEHNLLARPDDVFLLSYNEVRGLVRGTVVDTDPKRVIQWRKEVQHQLPEVLPAQVETVGVLATVNLNEQARAGAVDGADADERRGTAASPGRAVAPRVVFPAVPLGIGSLDGTLPVLSEPCVFVVHQLDLGLLPYLYAARGVIAERGSVLSEAAVMCRRLGIPVVVGIEGARAWAQDHPLISVDGMTGVVHRHERDEEALPSRDGMADPEEFTRLAAPTDPELLPLPKRPTTGRFAFEPTEPHPVVDDDADL